MAESNYQKIVKREKELMDEHPFIQTIVNGTQRGGECKVIIHQNTSETLRYFGRNEIISLYYDPEPAKEILHVYDDKRIGRFYPTDSGFLSILKRFLARPSSSMLKSKFESLTQIPAESIDEVFEMINNGTDPVKIQKFLER